MSSRVQDVFGAALRVAAKTELGVELSDGDSRELSVLGTLREALNRLKVRLTVRRAVPGTSSDDSVQVHLAVYEVAAEATGDFADDPTARRRFIRRAVEAEQARTFGEDRVASKIAEAEQICDDTRANSVAQRQFIRRVDRLRRKQLNRLQTGILDSETLTHAIDKLNDLYGRYISAALAIDGVTQSLPGG
jgi:hypothetical protein